MPKPNACQGCHRPLREAHVPSPGIIELKYCRKCRKYLCTTHCFGVDYCNLCEPDFYP